MIIVHACTMIKVHACMYNEHGTCIYYDHSACIISNWAHIRAKTPEKQRGGEGATAPQWPSPLKTFADSSNQRLGLPPDSVSIWVFWMILR